MFSSKHLQELLTYNSDAGQVVSLYLNTDIGQETQEMIRLKAKNLLKTLPAGFGKDVALIESYLEREFAWDRPGLAIFSSAAADFWRVYPTDVAFRNRIRVRTKPHVKPLAHLLDHYAHYGVILVDRLGARFYAYHLGRCQQTEGFMGEDVRNLKDGAGSSAVGVKGGSTGGRHENEATLRNLRDAAAAAGRFFDENQQPIRRVFLGGALDTVSTFQQYLPRRLQSCVAGQFQIDMDAPEHQVRRKAIELLGESNNRREAALVEEMINRANSGGNGVIGLDSTLKKVYEGRVQTLIVSDGFRHGGYSYGESGFLTSELVIDQSEAAGAPVKVDDVIEAAVAQTLAQGGHVELINDNDKLEQIGRIGAILRY